MAVRRAFKSNTKNKRKPFDISVDGEVFTCRGGISGGLLLDLISRFSGFGDPEDEDDDNVNAESLKEMNNIIRDFFTLAITRDDQERFFAFIDDPDREVEMELLVEIMQWLMEIYSNRPLNTPEDSTQNS